MGETGSGDEMGEVLIVGFSRNRCKGLICAPIRQLMVSLGKVIILVQDDSHVAHIGRENEDVGVVRREQSADFFWISRGWVVELG